MREDTAAENRHDVGVMARWRGKNPGRLLRFANVIKHLRCAAAEKVEPPTAISRAAAVGFYAYDVDDDLRAGRDGVHAAAA